MRETDEIQRTAPAEVSIVEDTRCRGSWREDDMLRAELELEDGTVLHGRCFGHPESVAGEVVFNTGMVGYPEMLTDPSYTGQIVVATYPLIGNYGAPPPLAPNELDAPYESAKIQAAGLIVSEYCAKHSHWNAARSLGSWLEDERICAIAGVDTRILTQRLRNCGTMLGVIRVNGADTPFVDPNQQNLVARVSIAEPILYKAGEKRVAIIDCGCKHNIIRSLLARDLSVIRVPWDHDLSEERYDGVVLSNGPGDPEMASVVVKTIERLLEYSEPVFGICMGHQLMAQAIGARTYKLKYGHRGQNQPVIETGTDTCSITSQNHGYAVDASTIPRDWREWFTNLNDGTNEGLRHTFWPHRSVQFHPEACPGPTNTAFLFDEFARMVQG